MKYFHLTTPQQNIWNLQKYYNGTAIANLCGAVFFQEKRDSALIQEAICQFIHSQSGIRLRFHEGEEPMQYVSEGVDENIPVRTFRSREEFDSYAESFARDPIGLSERQMYRFVVFQLEKENKSGILVTLSHLISDAWTFGLMANQLDAAYRQLAGEGDVTLLKGDYADFIQSEDAYLASGRYEKDKSYWEGKYTVRPEESPVKLRSASIDSVEAERITRTLPSSLEQGIAAYCRSHPVTEAVLFETALIIYLSRINPDIQTVTVGVPMLNRSNAREKEIVGMFVSTMPLTVAVTGDTEISELAGQITKGHMDLFRHQKYPYAGILRQLREKHDFSGNLYDVMVSYQNAKTKTGADTKWYSNGCSEVPLLIHIDNRDGNECHTINVDYQTAVFRDGAEVELLIDRLEYILDQIVAEAVEKVGDIGIVPQREYDRIVYEFNDTYVDYPREKCIHELFVEQAKKTPEQTALVFEDKKFTYRQLDEMSNSLAHFMREKGIQPGNVVPIIAKRSWHVVVAMLGVLKAGGAYMPVDPNYPEDRVNYMLETSGSRFVLLYGYERMSGIEIIRLNQFGFGEYTAPVGNINSPEDPAYIIFTSGSTGKPKGVTVCHRNICNYADDNAFNSVCHKIIDYQCRSIVSVTNIIFDIFVTESLLPLVNGLCIYFASDAEAASQSRLGRLVEKNGIDVLQTTPTKMRSYLMDRSNTGYLKGLRAIILGGEAFPQELYHTLRNLTDAHIYNIYGPAETTVWSTNAEVTGDDITIGTPIANTQIYILDSGQRPIPVGVPGELCIAGEGVGKGYLNRPELTAERFVPNPFATEKNHHGKVMYRTGDLARFRSDGEIEYLGRMDTQVKIRGLRIELGEIESVMGSLPGIGLCAVADKRDETGRQYMVGYYTADRKIAEKELRRLLSAKLPKYMVPNYFMRLEAMPMTASGKTDRKSLPVPDFAQQMAEYTPPETDMEKRLAEIWQELLHTERVGRTDDFFELGGDSLLAISMLSEIEKSFHVEVSVREVMEHSGLAALARCLKDTCGSVCPDTADGGMSHGTAAGRITARHADRYPMPPQQKAVYAACMKEPGTLVYNMPARLILPDTVDRDRLKGSIARVLDQHKLLKSFVRMEETGLYGVYDGNVRIVFEEYETGKEDAFVRPFDLGRAPLVRVGFTEDSLLFDMHHIIADGTSMNILLREIAAVYGGGELQEQEADYPDYAEYFYGMDTSEHKAYFQEMLRCNWEPVMLPETKNPGTGGESRLYQVPEEVFSGARKYAKENGLTDTMVFLGAYGILLSKYTGRKEILSSIILQNRTHADTRDMVGMFVNTLPVCLALGNSVGMGDSVKGYMQEVKEKLLGLFRYQEMPFEDISEAVGMNDRSAVNTSFVYQGDGEKTLSLDGQELAPQFMDTHTAKFDLSVELTPIGKGCRLRLEYNLAKYDEQLMDALAEGYIRILGQLEKEKLSDISVLSEQEYHRIVEGFNDTYVKYPREKCVHELFMEQAAKTPERTALVFEDQEFTYRQLDEMSNSLAYFLRGKGVGANDVVPIIAKRSWHVIVAMLGILKAGGAYMPVDPNYPIERIKEIIIEAGAKLVFYYQFCGVTGIEMHDVSMTDYSLHIGTIENKNSSADLCYVIYTSGSTGQPKGICQTHKCLSNLINWQEKETTAIDCNILSSTIITFDVSLQEIMYSLLNGGCLYFTNDDVKMNISKYMNYIEKNKIDTLFITPSYFNMLAKTGASKKLDSVRKIFFAGEKLEIGEKVFGQFVQKTVIYNQYGPAETHVATSKIVGDFSNITIGTPIANTQIYILDSARRPVPIGVQGELCIAGEGVGKGYLNRPELTAERFVPNPFATEKNHHGKVMYRTGDLARFRSDGEIEYLGRMDTQVKIRGLRIELGEVESVMEGFSGVGLCAVADKRDETGRQYLVGYYTADKEIDEKELRRFLSAKLPKYMLPNYFMRLETMPMTTSGKTDRKSLPVPDFMQQTAEYVPPETDMEKRLAEIWQNLLHTERVGRTDDFFELGGDSLRAISMLSEIEKSFHVEVSVREVMEHSELEVLARCLEDVFVAVCPDAIGGSMVEGIVSGRIIASHADRYPLLPQQKAVYAACMKEPGTLVYNMPARLILPDAVDRDRLKESIAKVLDRHKLLKSCICMEETGFYGVFDGNARIVFEEYETGKEDAFVRPFDLGKAPLVRVGFTEDALLFDMHHIIADGASMNILLREIAAVYEGIELQEQGAEYPDYAEYFYGMDTSEHKAYFQEMLKCDWEPVMLPETKNPGTGGESRLYQVPEEVFSGARKYAKENGLTDTMVFLGAYGILLSKYTGRKEILSSIILQNRTHADTRDMVGMFVNTLPVCLALGNSTGMGDSVKGYMQEVKEKLLGLFRYQEMPFEDISEAVGMNDRSAVNTSFVYQGDGEKTLSLNGQELAPLFMDTHTAKFDLSMELTPTGNGCRLRLEYNLTKYDGQLMDALAEGYIRILGQLGKEKLADISVLSEEEYHRIVEGFNNTYVEYPREKCVHELFMEQAAKTPELNALVFEEQEFTYKQLDEMSNSLAHFLRERGIHPGDVVPLIAKRSWHVVVAMLGILKAGGAYMPINPDYPSDRIGYMLSEIQAKLVLVYGCTYNGTYVVVDLAEVDYGKHTGRIGNCNSSDDMCYVLYTSGSTGRPKAVCVSHANMVNFNNNNNNNHYQHAMLGTCSTVLADTEFVFDISAFEIFLSLLNGLCLILTKEIMDAQYLAELIDKHHVDALHITPTKLFALLHDRAFQKAAAQIKILMVGAEVFTENLYQTVSRYTDTAIYNGYGPTETTIGCSFKKVNGLREGADITIGTPIANTQIYILDSDQRPVPIGVPGELCIAGEGVGKGYLNRPELTAERFASNPFATEKNHHGKVMYRTGDLARFRSDGEIEYLGRMDTQVKIRGLRIELGEIESVMGSFPGIGLCAVADKRDETGRQYLVGYYTEAAEAYSKADGREAESSKAIGSVADGSKVDSGKMREGQSIGESDIGAGQGIDSELDEKALRAHLSAKLPKYMVPNYFMRLEAMPMTASGKTDRKNLPVPDFAQTAREYIPPVTEKEKELCRLMEELLHAEQVGVTDDFFELGGDSLAAIEFLAKAHDSGIVFALQNVFDYPTVRQLCDYMEAGDETKIHYELADFDKYQSLLAENVIDEAFVPERKSLGNVLLTGATGFLGAHVLDRLLQEETGKVYCLVRDGKEADGSERLREILRYYFGDRYEANFAANSAAEFAEESEEKTASETEIKEVPDAESRAESEFMRHLVQRIIPIAGDIELETLSKNMPKDVQTVIHTAASVKHYGSYEYFNCVNVEGTRHVVNYAKSVGARLIHISTLSVSGNSLADEFAVYRSEEEKFFGETSFYIGQPLDNVYIHSKFEAERAVFDAMLTGLDARIIRVGNLTSRASDYMFQPNYKQNAFLTRVKAILEFGLFPDYLMPLYSEFSPIDLTAEGVVKIAQYAGKQTVFHLNSNRPIYFDRFLEIVHELGISMKVVDGDSFNQALRRTIRDRVTEYIFEAFQNDMDDQGRLLYDSNIHIENDFTVWFLKKLGFEWNEIDMEYIRGYVEYFRRTGYLEV